MYFAWSVWAQAQTFGARVWGLQVIPNDEGEELFLGRAFLYAVAILIFGVLTPVTSYLLPSGRAVQDMIAGTRVVKVRVIRKKR